MRRTIVTPQAKPRLPVTRQMPEGIAFRSRVVRELDNNRPLSCGRSYIAQGQAAGAQLGITVVPVEVRNANGLEDAISRSVKAPSKR